MTREPAKTPNFRLVCPECGAPLTFEVPSCARGHVFAAIDGVLSLLSNEERAFFDARDVALTTFREDAGLRRKTYDFEGLPFSQRKDPQWRARCADVKLVRAQLRSNGERAQRILDFGSSNGWLSNVLQRDGCDVTAVDLFRDDVDGLGAMRRYPRAWRSICMDVEKPERIGETFDLLVINHGIHFLRDPVGLIAALQRLVAPGGALIALGLRVFVDVSQREHRVAAIAEDMRRGTGGELLNGPTRGLLDSHDADALRSLGLRLRWDPHHRRANLRAMVQRHRALHLHGIWRLEV